MIIHGELVPRHDATPEKLKALGAAIEAWFADFLRQQTEAGEEVDGWLDEDALGDLLHGELPQPVAGRCLHVMHGITVNELIGRLNGARERHPLAQRSLPPPQTRCLGFGFWTREEARDDLLASLRGCLPVDLLSAIRIDGVCYLERNA
jgi:hypothetical protein